MLYDTKALARQLRIIADDDDATAELASAIDNAHQTAQDDATEDEIDALRGALDHLRPPNADAPNIRLLRELAEAIDPTGGEGSEMGYDAGQIGLVLRDTAQWLAEVRADAAAAIKRHDNGHCETVDVLATHHAVIERVAAVQLGDR